MAQARPGPTWPGLQGALGRGPAGPEAPALHPRPQENKLPAAFAGWALRAGFLLNCLTVEAGPPGVAGGRLRVLGGRNARRSAGRGRPRPGSPPGPPGSEPRARLWQGPGLSPGEVLGGSLGAQLQGPAHRGSSLYCTTAKRTPCALAAPTKGCTSPSRNPRTSRKLLRPMDEEPSSRKTISAA